MQINIHMGNVQPDKKGMKRMSSKNMGQRVFFTMKLVLIQRHNEGTWQEGGLDSDAKSSL